MWAIKLFQRAVIQNSNLIEVDDSVELVGHGNDGMFGEFLADDALDKGIGDVVDAKEMKLLANLLE